MGPSEFIALLPSLVFLLVGAFVWTVPGAMSVILTSADVPDVVRGIGGVLVLLGGLGTAGVLGLLGGSGLGVAVLGLVQAARPVSRIRLGEAVAPRQTGLVLAGVGVLAVAVSLL